MNPTPVRELVAKAANPGRQAASLRAVRDGAVTWSRTRGVRVRPGASVGQRMFEWAESAKLCELQPAERARFRFALTERGYEWLALLEELHPEARADANRMES